MMSLNNLQSTVKSGGRSQLLGLFIPIVFVSFFQMECLPAEYSSFLKQSKETQRRQFVSLPLSKQVDYITFCFARRTCEDFYWDSTAGRGKSALPYLLERMKTSDDSDKYLIANILSIMNKKYYKISDPNDVSTIKKIVAQMEDSDWKDMTVRALSEIIDGE